ncbi:MAG: exodeoxyribonuclease III [Caulobacterales bacterium]
MRIATWNVNSITARLGVVEQWLKLASPDVVCLQELKCEDAKFPRQVLEDLGYNVAIHGQKTYNGVAILSKTPLEDVRTGLPGDADDNQSRYIEAIISGPAPIRVASIYLPNGNPLGTDKFTYKIGWFSRLHNHARELLKLEEPLILAGDYNVIPREVDCVDPKAWINDALFQPESRGAWRALLNLGFADAYMTLDGRPHQYTFWDYQAGAWPKNNGIRIDHMALSPQAADRLKSVHIDRDPRGWEKPSDHTPLVAEFDF